MVAAAAIRLGPGEVTALLERTQSTPGTTPTAAAGMAPAARRAQAGVWRRDPRDREQGRHYRPPRQRLGRNPRWNRDSVPRGWDEGRWGKEPGGGAGPAGTGRGQGVGREGCGSRGRRPSPQSLRPAAGAPDRGEPSPTRCLPARPGSRRSARAASYLCASCLYRPPFCAEPVAREMTVVNRGRGVLAPAAPAASRAERTVALTPREGAPWAGGGAAPSARPSPTSHSDPLAPATPARLHGLEHFPSRSGS